MIFSLTFLCAPASFSMQDESNKESDDIERIIVTADLNQGDLSTLPIAATVLNTDVIENRQARHLQDLVSLVPNLNFSSGASRGKFIQIRGIGERSQFAEPINPSVGILLDDIDISGIGGLATVFDLQQVEVLSGPQSVATGMNSLAGIVKLVSNKASEEEFAQIIGTYGQFNESRLAGVYSNSLTQSVNGRFNIQSTKSDGFVENSFLNREDTNGIDELSATAKFDIELSEKSMLALNLYHFDINNGYDAFSLDNDNITRSDEPGFDRLDAQAASVKYSHDFSAHKLQMTVSSIQADTDYGYDEDWTFVGFHPFEYSSFDRYQRDITRRSVDVKLANIKSNNDTLEYLVGANFNKQKEDLLRVYTFNEGDYSSQYEPTNSAVYGQVTFSLSDDLALRTAARVEKFDADFVDIEGFFADIDDTLIAASASLEYKLNNSFFYAKASRGYKAGGFNIDQRLDAANRIFDPEFNNSIELGLKTQAKNLFYTFTIFHMRRDDAQVSDFAVFTREQDDGSVVTSFADVIGNAGSGINQGIEFSATWDISDSWFVQANLGYLEAHFDDYTKVDGSVTQRRQQAQAPYYSGFLSSNWQISDRISWYVDMDMKNDFGFSDGHDERAPFTAIVNTELNWQKDSYKVQLWVKNIFDRQQFTRGFGGFSNDPRDEYAFVEPYYQFGQQRQVGLSVTYTWE